MLCIDKRVFLLENMNNKFHQTSKKLVSREIKQYSSERARHIMW